MPYLGVDPSRIPRSALDEWQTPRASFGYEPFANPSRSPYERPFDLPMTEGEYATKLRSIAAAKARDARARGSAADSQRAIQLFDSMTPEQTARIYSGAPQSQDELELQRRLQQSETAGDIGFKLGYASDIANVKNNRARAIFDRQIRDSDLGYQTAIEREKRNNELLGLQTEDRQIRKDREERLTERDDTRNHRGVIESAIQAAAGGTITPGEVADLFPELDEREIGLVMRYAQQSRATTEAGNRQSMDAAESANAQLKKALLFFQAPENAGKSYAQKQKEFGVVVDALKKEAQRSGLMQYDANMRSFVPVLEPVTQSRSGNPFSGGSSATRPAQRRQSPSQSSPFAVRPSATLSGAVYSDKIENGGISSSRFAHPFRATGDWQIDAVNQMMTDADRANFREGQIKVGPTGKRYIYRGHYFEPLP